VDLGNFKIKIDNYKIYVTLYLIWNIFTFFIVITLSYFLSLISKIFKSITIKSVKTPVEVKLNQLGNHFFLINNDVD